MATYTLTINERTSEGRGILALLRNSMSVRFDTDKSERHKNGLDEAIDDFNNGRTTKCVDFDDYLKKINS